LGRPGAGWLCICCEAASLDNACQAPPNAAALWQQFLENTLTYSTGKSAHWAQIIRSRVHKGKTVFLCFRAGAVDSARVSSPLLSDQGIVPRRSVLFPPDLEE
jgi:hypothetical protein